MVADLEVGDALQATDHDRKYERPMQAGAQWRRAGQGRMRLPLPLLSVIHSLFAARHCCQQRLLYVHFAAFSAGVLPADGVL